MFNFKLANKAFYKLNGEEFKLFYFILNNASLHNSNFVELHNGALIETLNCSERKIQRLTKSLENKGFVLKITQGTSENKKANRYQIAKLEDIENLHSLEVCDKSDDKSDDKFVTLKKNKENNIKNTVYNNRIDQENQIMVEDYDTALLNNDLYIGELDEWNERLVDEAVEEYMSIEDLDTSNSNVEGKSTKIPTPIIINNTESHYEVETAPNRPNKVHGDYRQLNERFNKIYEELHGYREEWKTKHTLAVDRKISDSLQSAIQMYLNNEITKKQIEGFERYIMGYFKMRVRYNRKLIDTVDTLQTWFQEALRHFYSANTKNRKEDDDLLNSLINKSTELYDTRRISTDVYEAFLSEICGLYEMKQHYPNDKISMDYKALMEKTYPFLKTIDVAETSTLMSRSDEENGLTFSQTNETTPKKPNNASITALGLQPDKESTSETKTATGEGNDDMKGSINHVRELLTKCKERCNELKSHDEYQNTEELKDILQPLSELVASETNIKTLHFLNHQYQLFLDRIAQSPDFNYNAVECMRSAFNYAYEGRLWQISNTQLCTS